MPSNLSFRLCFFLMFMFMFLCQTPTFEASNTTGFSVQLICRNSRDSPFHKHRFHSSNQLNQFTYDNYLYEYLMQLQLGTPPVEIYGAYNTGSSLVWTQCTPCPGCYMQKNPMFDPLKSQSYNNINCGSEQCKALPYDSCYQNLCVYKCGYLDSSVTSGLLASEIVAFNSTDRDFVLRDFVFGCGHNNKFKVVDENIMGIIGFDRGPLSLISQIGNIFGDRRFSQCLVSSHVDHNIGGKVNFGAFSEASSEGVVITPLVTRENPNYYVTIKGVSVGNKFLPFNPSQPFSEGYMVIDSGSPPCHVPLELYNGLVEEIRSQIGLESIVYEQRFDGFLCFRNETFPDEGPILTFHFDGADVRLMPTQTFFIVEEGVFCFGMEGVTQEPYVFGNFAQSNILIGFDLDKDGLL